MADKEIVLNDAEREFLIDHCNRHIKFEDHLLGVYEKAQAEQVGVNDKDDFKLAVGISEWAKALAQGILEKLEE